MKHARAFRRAGAFRALLAGALMGLLAWPAPAYVPPVERVAGALATANRKAGRARPLQIDVGVRVDEVEVAAGTWVADPGGLARLELRHLKGFRERHLLLYGNHLASRDGAPLPEPRPLLPPLAWAQAASGPALVERLATLGIDTRQVALGYEGDHDCYVIGGRSGGAAVWVDVDTREPVRLDWRGMRIWFGPTREEGGIRLPAWLELDGPGAAPLRLEIRGVRPTSITPETFASDWLAG